MSKFLKYLIFLKIKDLKELKETLKNPLSQEGIKWIRASIWSIGL